MQWAADKVVRIDRWVGNNWVNLTKLVGTSIPLLGGCYRGLKIAWEISKGRTIAVGVVNPEGAAALGLGACGAGMAIAALQVHKDDWK